MTLEQEFEQYLIENGIAPKTIESYVGDVKAFNQYLRIQNVENQEKLKRFYIVSYKKEMIEHGYKVATINKKINSIQAYNIFLIENIGARHHLWTFYMICLR